MKLSFNLLTTTPEHEAFAAQLCQWYEVSARQRGTGIARRQIAYLRKKIRQGNAIIAFHREDLAGFCYIETWTHGHYVANSGLIVSPNFRKQGLAKAIKKATFQLARDKYPAAKVFGITTSLAVMKINSELGYQPVTFSELTPDEAFWDGCQSCPNYDILQRNKRQLCLCTGMLAPSKKEVMSFDLSHQILNYHV